MPRSEMLLSLRLQNTKQINLKMELRKGGRNESDLKRDVRSSPKRQHLCFGKRCRDGAPQEARLPHPWPAAHVMHGVGDGSGTGDPALLLKNTGLLGESRTLGEGNGRQRGLLEGSEVEK